MSDLNDLNEVSELVGAEKEEKTSIPSGSRMWEIEVPVSYARIYNVPGTSPEDALDFFCSGELDDSDLYEFFCEGEDEIYGVDMEDAYVTGTSPSWVKYKNRDGETIIE